MHAVRRIRIGLVEMRTILEYSNSRKIHASQ